MDDVVFVITVPRRKWEDFKVGFLAFCSPESQFDGTNQEWMQKQFDWFAQHCYEHGTRKNAANTVIVDPNILAE